MEVLFMLYFSFIFFFLQLNLVYSLSVSSIQHFSKFTQEALSYSDFTAFEHPLNSLARFKKNGFTKPTVLRKYYFRGRFERSTEPGMYSPRSASYVLFPSLHTLVDAADVLSVHHARGPVQPEIVENFGQVHLNYPARVLAILTSFHHLRAPSFDYTPRLSGIPNDWKIIGVVKLAEDEPKTLGEDRRWEGYPRHTLQMYGVAVEIPLPSSLTVTLRHPTSIYINDDPVRHLSLVFVDAHLNSFPETQLPVPFPSLINSKGIIDPSLDPPIPNKSCPVWLHDLYVVENKNRTEAKLFNEPLYWKTWHPQVDPLFWCYFEHEHGSYPGKDYRPAFGYTAFKNVEDESHEGFKIYAIPSKNSRLIVITLHMHVSKARRLKQRFHTIIFTITSPSMIEMELFMKADFGGGFMYTVNGHLAIDDEELARSTDIRLKGRVGGRVFNVLNIDEYFPNSINYTFSYKGDINAGPQGVMNGLYEQWKAALNTCSGVNSVHQGALVFDVRDPISAIPHQSSTIVDSQLQSLNGYGLKRILMIRASDFHVGEWWCDPRIRWRRNSNGILWTDPYMKKMYTLPGNRKVRQTVIPGMKPIVMREGLLRAADPWSGWYEYEGRPGLEHIERGALKLDN